MSIWLTRTTYSLSSSGFDVFVLDCTSRASVKQLGWPVSHSRRLFSARKFAFQLDSLRSGCSNAAFTDFNIFFRYNCFGTEKRTSNTDQHNIVSAITILNGFECTNIVLGRHWRSLELGAQPRGQPEIRFPNGRLRFLFDELAHVERVHVAKPTGQGQRQRVVQQLLANTNWKSFWILSYQFPVLQIVVDYKRSYIYVGYNSNVRLKCYFITALFGQHHRRIYEGGGGLTSPSSDNSSPKHFGPSKF